MNDNQRPTSNNPYAPPQPALAEHKTPAQPHTAATAATRRQQIQTNLIGGYAGTFLLIGITALIASIPEYVINAFSLILISPLFLGILYAVILHFRGAIKFSIETQAPITRKQSSHAIIMGIRRCCILLALNIALAIAAWAAIQLSIHAIYPLVITVIEFITTI